MTSVKILTFLDNSVNMHIAKANEERERKVLCMAINTAKMVVVV